MLIATRHFGEVEIDEAKIIVFEKGIFGFEDIKKYIVLYDGEEGNPFAWLQSIEEKSVALPMIKPMAWYPNYSPDINDDLIESIGKLEQEPLEVFSVVVIPDKIENMTTNLRAPIILNKENKKGIQAVANDEEYNIRENLYELFQKMKKAGE